MQEALFQRAQVKRTIMDNLSRRDFLRNGLVAGAVASLVGPTGREQHKRRTLK
jgi:hypothetical protein